MVNPEVSTRKHNDYPSAANPLIAAAFNAFHHKAARLAAGTYARALLAGGGWIFVALAVLGFVGGLSLAVFSSDSPDRLIKVAAHAPEMLYAKPAAQTGAAEESDSHTQAVAVAAVMSPDGRETVAVDANANPPSKRDVSDQPKGAEEELVAIVHDPEGPLPEANMNFAAATRIGAIGAQARSAGGSDVTVGFEGVELPSVPEPANGVVIAVALGAFILLTRATPDRSSLR